MPTAQLEETTELTAEQIAEVEQANAESDADFESGFKETGDELTQPEKENKPAAETKPVVEVPAVVPPVESKRATLSEQQVAHLLSSAKSVEELKAAMESRFGSAFGKMGGLERTIKELQAGTAAGEAVELTDADLAELTKEFPDVAVHVSTGLKRILSRIKGTKSAPAFDPETVKPIATEVMIQRQRENELEELSENHPNWNEVIGPVGTKTPYREWLGQQPGAYQTLVGNSWRASTVGRSIERFEAHQAQETRKAEAAEKAKNKKTPSQTATRAEILAEAVNQRGTPGFESGKSADDEFNEGFTGKK